MFFHYREAAKQFVNAYYNVLIFSLLLIVIQICFNGKSKRVPVRILFHAYLTSLQIPIKNNYII